MLRVRRRPRRWNLPACLHVDLLRARIFSRSLDEVTLTITREIAPVHPKPTGVTAVRWSQGSMPRKYATHDTYSLIFPVHKLRQTELTKDIRSKWRFVTVAAGRLLYSRRCWLAKGCSRWSPTANQWFFWLYSNARHTINIRRTSPGSWSQELSSHTKINEIRQWRPKWRQFKKVVSLAGAHHTKIGTPVKHSILAMAMNRRDHDQRAEHRHYDGSLTTQGTVSTLLRSASFDKTSEIEWFWRTMTLGTPGHNPKCPQIGVLLNNRATKLAAFLLYKFGVR